MSEAETYILKLTCTNQPGIVAAISRVIADHGGDILECQQFDDAETGKFLMRIRFSTTQGSELKAAFGSTFERFGVTSELVEEHKKQNVLMMVSKMDHCLQDLLYRWRKDNLDMDVVGIVSNHETTRQLAELYDVPYDVLPVTKENKAEQEQKLMQIIEDRQVDLVVLARYMQILSDDVSRRLSGKVINIHHSFLPSFKGARPYHQARRRGVKLIGATAHYVTSDLDEGPIIEQEVTRVKHSDTADELVRIGRDTECRVLARAVRWHLEGRVFLNGDSTVVFT
ncbi:MAG: formyltetrahydrofolate deformylase [Pseudomonadota bacterium]